MAAPARRPAAAKENVRVVVRFRPHNEREKLEEKKAKMYPAELNIFGDEGRITIGSVKRPSAPLKEFMFDEAMDSDINQEGAFGIIAAPPCIDLLAGFNATIFVYGQTGSGKTYTMLGREGPGAFADQVAIGLIPRSVMLIFHQLNSKLENGEIIGFMVEIGFLEIYLEKIRDLLDPFSKKKIKVRLLPNGDHHIPALNKRQCDVETEVFNTLTEANGNRTVSATKMNATSSRSHMVMMVKVTQDINEGEKKTSTLNFADLAGSEKLRKTEATGRRKEEAKKINLSLTQLGIVINELAKGKGSPSFRNSQLTQVLQDSLGGNCKTTLIVNCSKSLFNREEAIGSLEFGKRCKTIKNKAKVNQQFSRKQLMKMLEELKKENAKLQRQLENEEWKFAQGNVDESQLAEKMEVIAQLRAELDERNAETDALRESNDEVSQKLVAVRFQHMAEKKRSETRQARLEQAQEAISGLENEVGTTLDELQQRTEDRDNLTRSLNEQETMGAKLENDIKLLQNKCQSYAEMESTHATKIEALMAQIQVARASAESSSNKSSQENFAALQKLQDLTETLEAQLKDARFKNEAASETIHSLESRVDELENVNSDLEQSLGEFQESFQQEQMSRQEDRFAWSTKESEYESEIQNLSNELDEMESISAQRVTQFQQELREKDELINRLQRELEVFKEAAGKQYHKLENNYHEAEVTIDNQGNIISDKENVIREKEVEFGAEINNLRTNLLQNEAAMQQKHNEMSEMESSLAYLKKFNVAQIDLLIQADAAYATALQKEEEERVRREHEMNLKRLREIEEEDHRMAMEMQNEMEKQNTARSVRRQQLGMPPGGRHERAPSRESACAEVPRESTLRESMMRGSTVRGTRKKKFAHDVKVGEKIKLQVGSKGVVRFIGRVHFRDGAEDIIGAEMLDGTGNTDGTKDGVTYFECQRKKGKFLTHAEISHVYRCRAKDGKEEKLRFSHRAEVRQFGIAEHTPGEMFEDEGRPSQVKKQTYVEYGPGMPQYHQPGQNIAGYARPQLDRMTTDAQIELAMQLSTQGVQQFINPGFMSSSHEIEPPEQFDELDELEEQRRQRKKAFKRAESQRLMRNASVQILNELVDTIDTEEEKNEVIKQFVQQRPGIHE